eukprot:scaffold560187_cov13-Prasinocladus_malaysianus.AAC.1
MRQSALQCKYGSPYSCEYGTGTLKSVDHMLIYSEYEYEYGPSTKGGARTVLGGGGLCALRIRIRMLCDEPYSSRIFADII